MWHWDHAAPWPSLNSLQAPPPIETARCGGRRATARGRHKGEIDRGDEELHLKGKALTTDEPRRMLPHDAGLGEEELTHEVEVTGEV